MLTTCLFCGFCVITNSWRLESTSIFAQMTSWHCIMTSSIIVILSLSILNNYLRIYWVESLTLKASFYFQIKHEKKKKEEGKRAREDEDVVKALLFNAFEWHQYYNLKDLISITKQPVVRIAYEIQDVQHPGWGGGALLIMAYAERLPLNKG